MVRPEVDSPLTHVAVAGLAMATLAWRRRFPLMVAVQGLEPSDVAAAIVFLVGPWAVGAAVRQRAIHTEEALARADRLEREQEAQAATVREQKRTRIARELHDIVSHSISVVAIQTQAVRRRLGPEHAREAEDLAAVEATAREALTEMRRLFGVLRSSGEAAALEPQPGSTSSNALSGRCVPRGCASTCPSRDIRMPCRRASTSRRTGSSRRR